MRSALVIAALGCNGEKDLQRPDSEDPSDSAAPDTADSDAPGDSGGDTVSPADTVDTAPPADTADTADSGEDTGEAAVDCDDLPALPVAFKVLPNFAGAEDFTFDGAGNYLAFDGPNLVSISSSGAKTVLVPMGDFFTAAGMHLLADGDIVVNNIANNTVLRVGMDGSQTEILTGVSYPNGITVSTDNMVYVSGNGDSRIYEVNPDTGDFSVIAADLEGANGIALSPDGQTLYVCSFYYGNIWAIDRDGKGGWLPARELHTMSGGHLDGLNVDACGNLYVTEYLEGRIWRIDPDDPAVAKLVAQSPAQWIPNLHWGRGLGGFEADVLYVANLDTYSLLALDVGVGSTPQAFVPGK